MSEELFASPEELCSVVLSFLNMVVNRAEGYKGQ